MDINEIRRQSLEYAKGHVRTGEYWRAPKKKRRKPTFMEWFAASLTDPRKANAMLKERRSPWREGDQCNRCKTPVVRRTHLKPPKEKPGGYWFEWWFQCPDCHRMFIVEAAKRFFGLAPIVRQAKPPKTWAPVSEYKYGPPRAIDAPTENYKHQDPGDDGIAPWD